MDTIERAMGKNVTHIKVSSLAQRNAELIIENNALKNLIRGLPECKETHQARKLIGERRWEKRVLSEAAGDLTKAEQEHERLIQEEIDYEGSLAGAMS